MWRWNFGLSNLMPWTFQCSNFGKGTFWYALKSKPLNSQFPEMPSFLHKSHPQSSLILFTPLMCELSGGHVDSMFSLTLTSALVHPVECMVGNELLLSSLLVNTTPFCIFFFKFASWSDWMSKRLCQDVLSLQVWCSSKISKDELVKNVPTEEKALVHLPKVHVKMEKPREKSPYTITESEFLATGKCPETLQAEPRPHTNYHMLPGSPLSWHCLCPGKSTMTPTCSMGFPAGWGWGESGVVVRGKNSGLASSPVLLYRWSNWIFPNNIRPSLVGRWLLTISCAWISISIIFWGMRGWLPLPRSLPTPHLHFLKILYFMYLVS